MRYIVTRSEGLGKDQDLGYYTVMRTYIVIPPPSAPVTVLKIGSETWEPSPADIQGILDAYTTAIADKDSSVLAVNANAVSLAVIPARAPVLVLAPEGMDLTGKLTISYDYDGRVIDCNVVAHYSLPTIDPLIGI